MPDGRDAPEVVQVHLEHRLVRRLLSRFLSQGFQAGLSRISVIEGPGAQPRVVLMGRLAVYGAGAARLHEEIIPVTAIWTEAERESKPLRPLGESGEERTLNQLEEALRDAACRRRRWRSPASRRWSSATSPICVPTLERIADERLAKVKVELAKRGEAEAKSLAELLEQQRKRIAKATAEFDPNQLLLPGIGDEERRERDGRPPPLAEPARAPREGNPRASRSASAPPTTCMRTGWSRSALSISGRRRVDAHGGEIKRDPDLEWLDHVQPVGLVVAPVLLKELGLAPARQTQADTRKSSSTLVGEDSSKPALARSLGLLRAECSAGTRAHVAGSPGGPALPDDLHVRLPEHDTTLSPTWAVAELGGGRQPGSCWCASRRRASIPTRAARSTGWEATPHQRFERLLRETGVFAGSCSLRGMTGRTARTTLSRSCGSSMRRAARPPGI